MDNLKLLNRWNVDMARAIQAAGSDEFFAALFQAVANQVKICFPQVWLYHRDLPPKVLEYDIPKADIPLQIDRYLEGPYREDPFYQISMSSPRSHIYRLGRLAGGDFEKSAYYQSYYGDTGTVDEVIFLTRLEDGSVINFCVMRLPHQGEFSQQEYDLLYSLSEPIAAIIQSHCHRDDFVISNLLQPGLDAQIDQAFRTFGSEYVSSRERQVLELMLRGYGADITAERLDISLETVRRHRKSIYKKIDVNSQADLFALFINSMPYIGEAQGSDPLSVYMG